MRAIIFARGYDIHGQVEKCREYAGRKGYKVEGVIVGQGRELPEIIGGLGTKIDRVIVRDMSRLSRNAMENYTTQSTLEFECGALVEDASERPRDEAAERFMRNVIAAIQEENARERRKNEIRERMIMQGLLDE
jgi:DNA invertase Pin-like site-specific DNA recombinase